MSLIVNRAIVFVHYDKDDIVDDYVYHYLQKLQPFTSYLLFVSTAKLDKEVQKKLSTYCSDVIVRENIGYDFMSYKIGLSHFDYASYDEVVICNDSVYGPLYRLEDVFKGMADKPWDFWGITDNNDISYHLQSYFLVFRKKVINHEVFKKFWDNVCTLDSKDDIIEHYEIGLSKILLDNGFSSKSYTNFKPTIFEKIASLSKKITFKRGSKKLLEIVKNKNKLKRIGKINNTHNFWKEILLYDKSPFIKIELLRDNPMKSDISDWEDIINTISDYDTTLIKKHLQRMKHDK